MLNELAERIFLGNVRQGFWGPDAQRTLLKDEHATKDAALEAIRHYVPARNFGEILMLVVSEAAEALEHWRDGKAPDTNTYTMTTRKDILEIQARIQRSVEFRASDERQEFRIRAHDFTSEEHWTKLDLVGEPWQRRMFVDLGYDVKPDGVPSELADVIIRVLDACGAYAIDIDGIVNAKVDYNTTRPVLHGRER